MAEAGNPKRYGQNFERQVRELLDAHGAQKVREQIYKLAKTGKLDVKSIIVLEEIRRVEKLGG